MVAGEEGEGDPPGELAAYGGVQFMCVCACVRAGVRALLQERKKKKSKGSDRLEKKKKSKGSDRFEKKRKQQPNINDSL